MAPLGQVIFEELNPGRRKRVTFKALMTGAPLPTGGIGGWSRVERPKRKSITEWVGRDGISIEIPFIIDYLLEDNGEACEQQVRNLEMIAGIEAGSNEPSLFRLKSTPPRLMPHGYERARTNKWFLESVSWDRDTVIAKANGKRVRIGGTMIVSQFTKDSKIQRIRQKVERHNPRKFYVVKKGDTLQKIAAREDVYGDARKWREIAQANKIRDPKKLKVGTKLKIPPLATVPIPGGLR